MHGWKAAAYSGRPRLQFLRLPKVYAGTDKIKYNVINMKNQGNLVLLTEWTDEEARPMRSFNSRFGGRRIVAVMF